MQCAHEICTCETEHDTPYCDPACEHQGEVEACACGHTECETSAVIEPDLPVDVEAFDPHTLGESIKAPFVTPKADPPPAR